MDNAEGKSEVGAESEDSSDILPGFATINDFAQKALGTLMLATKASNELPAAGDDYDFYSSYEGFRQFCNSHGDRLLMTVQRLAGQQGVRGSQIGLSRTLEIQDRTDALIETNDTLLESAGALLDEVAGVSNPLQTFPPDKSRPQVIVTSWNRKKSDPKKEMFRLMHARNIARPQLKFKEKIDNSNRHFVPLIRHKLNALQPLPDGLTSDKPPEVTKMDSEQISDTHSEPYPHPYQYELDHLEPDPVQLELVESPSYKPLDSSPLTLVDNVDSLEKMRSHLKNVKEFAVDLEHHSYRSFQGFTCLMQISTADHDYIVDTLDLRGELHVLNDSFTDPKIVKVLHGADMDIQWLQRDLGVYVVNMFDTGQASRTLGFPRHSLASLLSRYCQVDADKQYQLADWRIRPLPDEMILYAREDTHYLLYIYHMMRNELIRRGNEQQNLLRAVLDSGMRLCLQRYKKPIFHNGSHILALKKNRKALNKKQLYAYKRLFAWRDSVARQEDESTGYVLPQHMMHQIAVILPKDQGGVLACCNPVPPLVKQNINEIHHCILEARGLQVGKQVKTKEDDIFASKTNTFSAILVDPLDSPLYCPHDLSHEDGQKSTRDSKAGSAVKSTGTSALHPSGGPPTGPEVRAAQPVISLVGDTSTTEGDHSGMAAAQKKVRLLKAFLPNPFTMYMPSSKPRQIAHDLLESDKITVGGKTDRSPVESLSAQSLSVWIMKKATERPGPKKATERPEPKTDDAAEAQTYETDVVFNPNVAKKRKIGEEPTEEERLVAIRQKGLSKKMKPSRKERKGAGSGAPAGGRQQQEPPVERVIEPFDYSKTDYSMFEESRDSRSRGRHSHRGRGRGHSKGTPRPRTNQDSGRRSMTYSGHHGGNRSHKPHWPSR